MRLWRLGFHWLALLALVTTLLWPSHAFAAQPGEELLSSSGSVNAGQTLTLPLYSPDAANLQIQVTGGAITDSLTFTLQNGASAAGSWIVRSGETTWGYATIANNAQLQIKNTASVSLNYTVKMYARGVVPNVIKNSSSWSGVARGAGIQSSIQLTVPTAGRYRLALSATGGSYQLKVDNNHILKTAVPNNTPESTDSTYYLTAGVHTFTITQNTNDALVTWSIGFASADALDTLPSNEKSAVLGGAFREEWIPIQLGAAQAVNINATITGAAGDSLLYELYNGNTKVYTSTNIFGGEVSWATSSLAAGANRLRVVAANNNSAALGYSISFSVIPQTALNWSGKTYASTSRANQGNSIVRLSIPNAGIYRITLGASSGRFQFLLGSNHIQKVVTDTNSTNFTAYIPSGTHSLRVMQDPAAASTQWSVKVESANSKLDTLTFSRTGGSLGGTGNAFREEWLPLQFNTNAPVNVRVVVQGANTDALTVRLYNPSSQSYEASKIYGGETFWAATNIISGTNRIFVQAHNTNTGPISYRVEVRNVDSIPSTWSGVALGNGLNSVIRVRAPSAGTYDIELSLSAGSGQVLVNSGGTASREQEFAVPAAINTTIRVPLTAGLHTFTFKQDTANGAPQNTWQIKAALRQTEQALVLQTVAPTNLPSGQQSTVTITGQAFENGTKIELRGADNSVKPTSSVVVSTTRVLLTIPANTPVGIYSIYATNPNGSTTSKVGVLVVGNATRKIYLPMVKR